MPRYVRLLHRLAQLYGVQATYRDATGRWHTASPEALLAVLQALGVPLKDLADVPSALRETFLRRWQRPCEPVAVTWEDSDACILLRLPSSRAESRATCRLVLENGAATSWSFYLDKLPTKTAAFLEGEKYVAKELPLPHLPPGYHRFTLDLPGLCPCEILVICAPRRAYGSPKTVMRTWGLFIPLYALHSAQSWGVGDFGDLKRLLNWAREVGAGLVGTLPLLAAYLDEPFETSPYAPVSRLFWNELYLDITRAPQLAECPEARRLVESPAWREELAKLGAVRLVDYRRAMAFKRQVLSLLVARFFEGGGAQEKAFRSWLAGHPEAKLYALFRAATERRRTGWLSWPERMRRGLLTEEDGDPAAVRYHLYVQWLASRQIEELSSSASRKGTGLYLDLPLGVHPAGYDTWRWQELFVLEARCGAPPDPFFAAGQDWGFPPLHPERLREQGYRYYISCLRHHLRHARALRLDHAMGLHRVFWVPQGLPAREGVYVRYRAEEFYAILTLESHRHRSLIIGEDLGTVPRYVRSSMGKHNLYRMYVLPFEMGKTAAGALRPVPAGSLACLNTHDMPPFAAFWENLEPRRRQALLSFFACRGLVEPALGTIRKALFASLAYLAASQAQVVMVNLEDLWLEREPQNIPGTRDEERPNWRRKARYSFEEFTKMPEVLTLLREIDALRGEGP